jgi:hypothetical protein
MCSQVHKHICLHDTGKFLLKTLQVHTHFNILKSLTAIGRGEERNGQLPDYPGMHSELLDG